MQKKAIKINCCGSFYKKHQTKIGTFYFFDEYVITEFNEGVTVSFDSCKDLCFLINKYYGDTTPYGVISNRINSYSVFPTDYFYLKNMFFNLRCIAVVNYINKTTYPFESEVVEKVICPRTYQSFKDLDTARRWLCSMIS
ncbi:hypothetical protein [Neptunitalea lumnitzerae]|uniref:STAS/SEC14 domain-containing protein n=1 Tax=Neptunitalea lumnitzerae TaxID=2965509 RepID=A0ABQ5MIE1_9FLAO|nr:hypothetical protein [Neptunitalea sp. Y10]GLB49164.1 hypothetical protein Y10_15320 [Neptunitalea sp. Y10]